jgi:peptidoglycan hydrolase CwlO-like protein
VIARRPLLNRRRLAAAAGLVAACAAGVGPAALSSASQGSLQNKLSNTRSGERNLRSGIQGDNRRIAGYQGRIDDLRARQAELQASLDAERAQLEAIQRQLRTGRARLASLRFQLAHDKEVLARQLVAQYESPPPDIVSVVIQSTGFADLLERVDSMKRVVKENTAVATKVDAEQKAVQGQVVHLADLAATQQRVTAAVLSQRDQVTQLEIAVVSQQQVFVNARAAKAQRLASLRAQDASLTKRLQAIQAAQAPTVPGAGISGSVGPFASHGGSYGFFQAPGTNYSVGSEPEIAARLDRLGKALNLHLIGISGYRTPQHSVEVGGFANDPHTRGQASDTPGIEGVPEATLNQFGLTRPFPGAAEADHIQLLGSI